MHLPHKNYPSEYWIFVNAKQRCNNPKNSRYKDWGERGIRMNYSSFDEFINDIGAKPGKNYSLDRINNDGNYEVGNCRWATRREQAINRSDNVHLTYKGETLAMVEWCERLNLNYKVIQGRISRGWMVHYAFEIPETHQMGGDCRRHKMYKHPTLKEPND